MGYWPTKTGTKGGLALNRLEVTMEVRNRVCLPIWSARREGDRYELI
jgi:hypothetical protein